jgi:hypothetical protein
MRGVDGINESTIDLLGDVVGSFVGTPTAANFTGYLAVGSKLPRPADILAGKVSGKKFELHEEFFISCGILAMLQEQRKALETKLGAKYYMDETFTKYVDNSFKFVKDSFDAETLAAFVNRFVGRESYAFTFNTESKAQKEWAKWLFSASEGASRLVYAN